MPSRRLKISIVFLILFLIVVGAKPEKSAKIKSKRIKKVKKVQVSPFQKLKKEYLLYKNSDNSKKDLDAYENFLLKFDKFTQSKRADEAIQSNYYIADINEKIFYLTNEKKYLEKAYELYKRLSSYDDAYGLAAQKKVLLLDQKFKISDEDGVKNQRKSEELRKLVTIIPELKGERKKVYIELDGSCEFEDKYLFGDKENDKPERIVLDIKNATYKDKGQLESILVDDDILEKIRVGQFSDRVLRIVLDLKTRVSYKTSNLSNPFRIEIEVWQRDGIDKKVKMDNDDLALVDEKLPLNTIVIDMGHGGHDPGAIGYRGIREKDVTLDIGKKLAEVIRKHYPKLNIILTRDNDFYLPLDERTAIANAKKADLFISIHANASKNKEARGVETYFLNFTKEERAKEVVARENASTLEGVEEVQEILKDLIVSSKYNESSILATLIQKNLVQTLKKEYPDVLDLGVKQGPFYVLLGAAMPSVLVETSFITNPVEGERLADEDYRNKLAFGIFEGLREYINKAIASKAKNRQFSVIK